MKCWERGIFPSFWNVCMICKNLRNSKQLLWSAASRCSLRQTASLPIDFSSSALTLVFDLTVKWYNSRKWKKTRLATVTETNSYLNWWVGSLQPLIKGVPELMPKGGWTGRGIVQLDWSLEGQGLPLLNSWLVNSMRKRNVKEHPVSLAAGGEPAAAPTHPEFRKWRVAFGSR